MQEFKKALLLITLYYNNVFLTFKFKELVSLLLGYGNNS